jgi:hypothetical protein
MFPEDSGLKYTPLGSWPYLQILGRAEKACQEHTLYLISDDYKGLITMTPIANVIKLSFFATDCQRGQIG